MIVRVRIRKLMLNNPVSFCWFPTWAVILLIVELIH